MPVPGVTQSAHFGSRLQAIVVVHALGSTIAVPLKAQAGDFAIVIDQAVNASVLPALVIPSGWTGVSTITTSGVASTRKSRVQTYWKKLVAGDIGANVVGMSDTLVGKTMLVFRPGGSFSTLSLLGSAGRTADLANGTVLPNNNGVPATFATVTTTAGVVGATPPVIYLMAVHATGGQFPIQFGPRKVQPDEVSFFGDGSGLAMASLKIGVGYSYHVVGDPIVEDTFQNMQVALWYGQSAVALRLS